MNLLDILSDRYDFIFFIVISNRLLKLQNNLWETHQFITSSSWIDHRLYRITYRTHIHWTISIYAIAIEDFNLILIKEDIKIILSRIIHSELICIIISLYFLLVVVVHVHPLALIQQIRMGLNVFNDLQIIDSQLVNEIKTIKIHCKVVE